MASTATAMSCVNDEAHYLLQSLLGWSVAYVACNAVDRTIEGDSAKYSYQSQPIPLADGAGIGLLVRR